MTNDKKHDKTTRRLEKLQEKQLLDAIHAIFKKSDLLKGHPPADSIFLPKPCPALLENLTALDRIDASVGKPPTLTKKRTMKKSPGKKGRKT